MFRIDLHVHTRYSGDNDADPREMVERAIRKGLHGLAVTEHYSYEASGEVECLREEFLGTLRIFRGVELSTPEGHCLVFGVNTDRLDLSGMPVTDIIRIVNDEGGVVIPSHPFRGGSSLGDQVIELEGITALEGYNGCNMVSMNKRAVDVARLLSIPYTGGSDAHAPDEVGSCYTEFNEEITRENLVYMLKKGGYRGVDTRKIGLREWVPGG